MKNTSDPKSERHPLYSAALKADDSYSATIERQFPGQTRWTLSKEQKEHPEVDAAYRAKVKADNDWGNAMRATRGEAPLPLPLSPEKPKRMTMDEMKAHLAERATEGACGLSWDEIEHKQGGKLRRP